MRVFFVLFSLIIPLTSAMSQYPKVLLISIDGLRFDMINETIAPNIHAWAKKWTWFVNGSQSQYLSFTASNHMSIVTGLFQESHGILSNDFYDTEFNETNSYFGPEKEKMVAAKDTKWYTVEPIWLTNQKAEEGRISSNFFWPYGDIRYPMSPYTAYESKAWEKYQVYDDWSATIEDVLNAFTRKINPSNFVSWYIDEPDHTLHYHGYFTGHFTEKMKEVDTIFDILMKKLESKGLLDQINIILTADHGHAEIKDKDHVMCVRDFIDMDSVIWVDNMIYPKGDEKQVMEIYKNLTEAEEKHKFGIKIYLRENFPEKFHYIHPTRTARIILEPKLGSYVASFCTGQQLEQLFGKNGPLKFNASTHGQDPNIPEMRAFLIMGGPAFKQREKIEEIPQNIDIYSLICHILEIDAMPNNGTMEIVGKALNVNYGDQSFKKFVGYYALALSAVISVSALLAHVLLRNRPVAIDRKDQKLNEQTV